MIDVVYGFKRSGGSIESMQAKFIYTMNILLNLRNGKKIMFNLHRESNLKELLKFFKRKKIPISENAKKRLEVND